MHRAHWLCPRKPVPSCPAFTRQRHPTLQNSPKSFLYLARGGPGGPTLQGGERVSLGSQPIGESALTRTERFLQGRWRHANLPALASEGRAWCLQSQARPERLGPESERAQLFQKRGRTKPPAGCAVSAGRLRTKGVLAVRSRFSHTDLMPPRQPVGPRSRSTRVSSARLLCRGDDAGGGPRRAFSGHRPQHGWPTL